MSEYTIEHAGVHYASHTLLDARRELERELHKDKAAMSLIKCDTKDNNNKKDDNDNDVLAPRAAPDTLATTAAPTRAVARATDRLDALGRHAASTYTLRNNTPSPPPPAATAAAATSTTAAEARVMQYSTHMQREYERTLAMLQQHRREREAVAALETFERYALADLWALTWEQLYATAARDSRSAALDTRARVARAHWHARLAQRRSELRAAIGDAADGNNGGTTLTTTTTTATRAAGDDEPLLHTPELLRLFDAEQKLSLWPEQLASMSL